jgi:ATP-dependent Clp protease ATP-binding subunit ClpA
MLGLGVLMQWQITQQEFTEMAWQAIVSSPEVAKENKHQIVETEHLLKALLEQKNGLARRIFSKVGVDNTRLLEATDKYIQRQPKVIYSLLYLNKFQLIYEHLHFCILLMY